MNSVIRSGETDTCCKFGGIFLESFKTKHVNSKWSLSGLAFVIPFIMVCIVFASKKITPFGSHNLLFSDMGAQYLPFLSAFRHQLLTHGVHLFSFGLSLGDNVTPLIAYYLLSPFNLLVLLFPQNLLPTTISVIIIFKIASIGLTTSIFLRRVYQSTSYSIVWFSTAFSLCGFVAMNFYTIMWLDALILLPLVALGIHRLIDKNRFDLYIVTLLLSIVTNYYLGYMTCLFSVLYFCYLIFKNSEVRFTATLKQSLTKIRDFFSASLLTGGVSAILLIPTFKAMLATGKGTFDAASFNLLPTFGLGALSQLEPASSNYLIRIFHYPSFYVGILVFLLLITYYYTEEIPQHYKNMSAGLLGILFLSMWVRVLNTGWHMLQQPAGFPFRNVFYFSFVCVFLAFEAWQTHPGKVLNDMQKLAVIGTAIGIIVLGKIGFFIDAKIVGPDFSSTITRLAPPIHLTLLTCLLIIIEATFLFLKRQTYTTLTIITLISFAEIGGNFFKSMYGMAFGNQQLYSKYFQIEYTQLDKLTDKDQSFYRLNNQSSLVDAAMGTKYNNYNDSLLFNYFGVSSYSSTLDNQTRDMLHRLGLFSKNVRRISSQGISPLVDTLLAMKYTNYPNQPSPMRNPNYAGIGFSTPENLATVNLSTNIYQNQLRLLKQLNAPAQTILPPTILSEQVTRSQENPTNYLHTLRLKVATTGPLFGYSSHVIYPSLRINGINQPPRIHATGHRYLMKFGSHRKNELVTISFASKHQHLSHNTQFFSYDEKKYATFIRSLRIRQFKLDSVSTPTHISGMATGTTKNKILFLSIPKETGWSAKVNGKSVQIKSVASHLMGIPLKQGNNAVNLTYTVPGFKAGAIISTISLLGLCLFTWQVRRKK